MPKGGKLVTFPPHMQIRSPGNIASPTSVRIHTKHTMKRDWISIPSREYFIIFFLNLTGDKLFLIKHKSCMPVLRDDLVSLDHFLVNVGEVP